MRKGGLSFSEFRYFLLNDAISILVNYLDTHESVVLCGGQLFDRERKPTGSYIEYPDLRFFLSLVLRGSVFYKDLPIFPEGEIPLLYIWC